MLRTLSRKVLLTAGIFFVLITISMGMLGRNLLMIERSLDRLTEYSIPQVDQAGQFDLDLMIALDRAKRYQLTRNPRHYDAALVALKQAEAALAQLQQNTTTFDLDQALLAKYTDMNKQRAALFQATQQNITDLDKAITARQFSAGAKLLEAQGELGEQVAQLAQLSNVTLAQDVGTSTLATKSTMRWSMYSIGSVSLLLGLLLSTGIFALYRSILRPVKGVAQAAIAVADGDFDQTLPQTSSDEIGDLQRAFNQMVVDLREQRTAIEQRNAELEQSLHAQQQLFATIKQLSAPLLPLLDGVVVLPIVGHVDTQRADAIMQTLLHGVAQRRARVAILDVTGIAMLDTYVTKLLLQAVKATELLGAQVIVAGISSAMAQILVQQGVSLGNLLTYRDLRSAIDSVLLAQHQQINTEGRW